MRYQDRKRYEQAFDYYKRAAEISRRRLERERREHNDRIHDRLAIGFLMVCGGIALLISVHALMIFAHWAQYGY